MKIFRNLASLVLLTFFTISCSAMGGINTKYKEKHVTTGLFGGNAQKMADSVQAIRVGIGTMTMKEVSNAGFDFNAENVECKQGAAAMPLIVGNVQNVVDLSTAEKIDAYAKTLSAYQTCLFPEYRIKSQKPRFYLSESKEKTKGQETAYLIVFKNGILFDAREITRKKKNESESEKSWGGNAIETLIGLGASGMKFK